MKLKIILTSIVLLKVNKSRKFDLYKCLMMIRL
ncbi:hypothetical protein Bhyg_05393 [Pseudolycoriella hygida]|uniref:Uncharacterized protein n=1 Tax=Pseudolycoriella hygida TaxID=35572 RepID=A0A9Q0NHY7_9DIPT|nr:hypothetical protein Bhyg_05393 [Pseudolycoriella hygida]